MSTFRQYVMELWRRALQRRSQRDRSIWARIAQLGAEFLPPIRILHPWPSERFAVKYPPPRVFISYSHDSLEHARHVIGLAERLRKDGVDAQLDQYVAGTPARGWPRWMEDQLDSAQFVLVICTETYHRRFLGREEPDKGKGADWESSLITLEMYHARSDTNKFVAVLFDAQAEPFIPRPLSGYTHYLLNSEDNYAKLYAFLTGQAGAVSGKLGPLKTRAREAVEPLTFEERGKEAPASGKLAGVPDRPSPYVRQETNSGAQRSRGSRRSGKGVSSQERSREILLYAVISLICSLCGVGILSLMILNADLLGRLGLTGNLYYLVLLPMGLAASGFLFGVLRSYARYSGKQLGGMLELGGPIVAFLLVVILGFVLVKPITTFPMTVYVHGEAGRQLGHDPEQSGCRAQRPGGPERGNKRRRAAGSGG
jgi:hypothetical protein